MKLTYKIVALIVLVSPISLWSSVVPANGPSQTTETGVRETVEEYCRADFSGVRNIRLDVAKFSPGRDAREKARDHSLGGRVIEWDGDPLIVVNSYKILKMEVRGNRAEALISYERLARSKGDGVLERELILDHIKNDHLRLELTFDSERWWILDPPLPRISKTALIKFYEDHLKNYESNWLQRKDITEIQKRYVYKRRETLEFLKKLK